MDCKQPEDRSPSAAADHIIIDIDASTAIVAINRIPKRNALTLSMWRYLTETFISLSANSQVRAVILTGAGNSFCAGADISEFEQVRSTAQQIEEYEAAVDACTGAIAATPKPTIAVINGYCMGGGCGLAMACDFRFSHFSSTFGIPAARLSIVYGVTGMRRLMALVGLPAAKRILYSAERFDARKALEIGFIDQLDNDPLAKAQEFCALLAHNAPLTISGTKALLDAMATSGLPSADHVADVMAQAMQSDDYREGRTAFMEKRAPVFHGT
jgi:enoyl-CoA hydratase/carnithine racemase